MSPSTEIIAELAAEAARMPDEPAWRAAYRRGFARLRTEVDLHPAQSTASATFEVAARTARAVAAQCLPLGIAVVMHLYPLGALRCVALPWWSAANYRRFKLLRAIEGGSLILANAGSERTAGAHQPVTLSRTRDGIRVDGTYDYVSLANVADVVLFHAPLAQSTCTIFCAADLRSDSVRIGGSRFDGGMRLSDTCSVTFDNHLVPMNRQIVVPSEPALNCVAQYQRSWFHLLLGESYLARIDRLRRIWDMPHSTAEIASLNELAWLREYALRLIDDPDAARGAESLSRITAAMKLRISWLAQSTADALHDRDAAAVSELRYFRRQPTSDDRILRSICADTRLSATNYIAVEPHPCSSFNNSASRSGVSPDFSV
ncbi:MAG TPA: acyl-CoA dehydrogenase family protein [Steroidobacteraceae bacterium]|nr:acyl-CoA dehydrogenase family protein [Steroidobacteraceae bacterium]